MATRTRPAAHLGRDSNLHVRYTTCRRRSPGGEQARVRDQRDEPSSAAQLTSTAAGAASGDRYRLPDPLLHRLSSAAKECREGPFRSCEQRNARPSTPLALLPLAPLARASMRWVYAPKTESRARATRNWTSVTGLCVRRLPYSPSPSHRRRRFSQTRWPHLVATSRRRSASKVSCAQRA